MSRSTGNVGRKVMVEVDNLRREVRGLEQALRNRDFKIEVLRADIRKLEAEIEWLRPS